MENETTENNVVELPTYDSIIYSLSEEFPLNNQRHVQTVKRKATGWKGPWRVFRLMLGILIPGAMVIFIVHMRSKVYIETLYPLAVSDMRMLDNRISTTWCQAQTVKVNATFNAYLLPQTPSVSKDTQTLKMVRHLILEDDTKEYWGFYLIKGSVVTLSTCVRWPGASLIVIRGHKHLHECAYIGDNSSEELDEVLEAIRDGTYVNTKQTDAPPNAPDLMKRHRQDVLFHDPAQNKTKTNQTLPSGLDNSDITDDPKKLKQVLDVLSAKAKKDKPNKHHIRRNSTIGKGESNNFDFSPKILPNSKNDTKDEVSAILKRLHELGSAGYDTLKAVNEKFNQSKSSDNQVDKGRQYKKFESDVDIGKRRRREIEESFGEDDSTNDLGGEEGYNPDGIADHHGMINETTLNDKSNSEFWSSFSSSEEALLNCSGLILNLPLNPHRDCRRELQERAVEDAYLANTISYTVPTNGYYFFVFNSENEIQPNYIRVRFHIEKTLYNVSNPVRACKNQTSACELDFNFFSSEKLVMELPVSDDEDLFNEEFIVVSQCQPRTMLYTICVIAIPFVFFLFSFK